MSIGIYKITNLINGKVYIGQSKNIESRWKKHKTFLNSNKHHNMHLQSAWNMYGESAFDFEIITCCEVCDLDRLEIEYISKFDSFKNGYNLSAGGNGCKGYKHSEEQIQKMIQIQNPKPVLQLDLNGNIINEYPSASMAAKKNNICARQIKNVCEQKGHQKTAHDYIWVYKENYNNDEIMQYYLNNQKVAPKPVNQYDFMGSLIQTFPSIYEASKKTGVLCPNILVGIKTKTKRSGYYWKLKDENIETYHIVYYIQTLDDQQVCFPEVLKFANENSLSESGIHSAICRNKLYRGARYQKIINDINLI